ncbi:MAG: flippase, partial [Oscillospiraceae bacterium]
MSKSIIKNSFYSVLKTTASLIFPIISFSYASRILLPDGMGKIDFSKSFVFYFTLLAMLGIQNYGIRECARVRDDRNSLSKTAREIMKVNFVSVLISYALFFSVICLLDSLSGYRELLLINCLTMGLTAIGMEWLYSAVEDYKYIAVRTCIVQAVSLICMLIFVRTPEDINKYAAIHVLSNGGAFLFNFVHSRKYIDWKNKYNFEWKRHLKPIFALFLMSALIQVFTAMDSTMLGFLTNDKAVGLYSASNKISGMVSSAVCSVTLVLTPRIAYYAERNMLDDVKKLSVKALNCIFMLCIPAAAGLIMLSMPILLIFSGSSFAEADVTSKIISLRNLLVPANTFIVLHLFIPLKREKYNLVSTGAAAALNFVMNLILIPKLLQNGAAIATVAAELIEFIINLFYFSRFISLKIIFKDIWQYVIAAVPIIPICYFLSVSGMNML